MRHGHSVVLYCYDAPAGVPAGVKLLDAARILPASRIVRHYRTKGLSVFADHFRYKLLHMQGGTWIDCDLYCLKPFDFPGETLFGRSAPDVINNALLRLPAGSPLAEDLVGIFEHKQAYLPWLLPSTRRRAWLRHHLYRKPYYAVIPIGNTGPAALTWFAEQHGLSEMAQEPEVFYPVRWEDAGRFAEADFDLASQLTSRCAAIHLWNDVLRHRKEPPEPGSLLARIEAEGRGGPPAL